MRMRDSTSDVETSGGVTPSIALDELGAVAVEYVVLVGFVALASLPAFISMGKSLSNAYEGIRDMMLWPMP